LTKSLKEEVLTRSCWSQTSNPHGQLCYSKSKDW